MSLTRTILLRMGFALLIYTGACVAGYYLLDEALNGVSLGFYAIRWTTARFCG